MAIRHEQRKDKSRPKILTTASTGRASVHKAKAKTAKRVSEKRIRRSVHSACRASANAIANASEDSDLDDFPPPPGASEFSYLKPQTRHVAQDKVVKEWKAMPDMAQRRVADVLVAARRGVVNTAKTAKRAEETSSTIEPLLRRIVSRLPRMLAPPKTKDLNFDIEKLLEQSRSLEAQLTASLHSIELLKAEIRREEDNLAGDEARLLELENNVKSEEALWKRQTKRAKDAIVRPELVESLADGAEDIGLVQETEGLSYDSLFDDDDPQLVPILSQLRSHLESISANGAQLHGVMSALEDSSLAVEAVVNR